MAINKKLLGVTLALAAASLTVTATTSAVAATDGKEVNCYGINGCKGKSDCNTSKNTCSGSNACKGQGFKVVKSQEECLKAGGTLTEKKS